MKRPNSIFIQHLFDSVAPSYDLFNDLFSFGLHRHWKRQLLHCLKPSRGEVWIDMCCGTGDLAFELARKVRPGGHVIAVDNALGPLKLARGRKTLYPWLPVDFIQRDALKTGLKANTYDGVVMSYGLRNLSDALKGMKELSRLLKPGGKAGIIDFAKLDTFSLQGKFQSAYLQNIVLPITEIFGFYKQYDYLKRSLETFLDGSQQKKLAIDAGFSSTKYFPIAFGQMGILLMNK